MIAETSVQTRKKPRKNSEFLRVMKQLSRNKTAVLGLVILLIEIVLAILAPYIAPYDYTEMDFMNIFSRILIGARYSLSCGILATLIGTVIGMAIGAIAGFFGGKTDNIIMRVLDVIQAIPGMVMMIVMSAVLGPGFINTIIAMAFGTIAGMARMLRAQMLKVRENEYIEASVSINCSKFRIIMDHLIPNCMSPMIVQATMGVAQTITTASGLSFIGLGVQPPAPEWGAMLSGSRQFIRQAPHLVIFPGLAIAVTVLALNMMGDGLRDALDPKLKN